MRDRRDTLEARPAATADRLILNTTYVATIEPKGRTTQVRLRCNLLAHCRLFHTHNTGSGKDDIWTRASQHAPRRKGARGNLSNSKGCESLPLGYENICTRRVTG